MNREEEIKQAAIAYTLSMCNECSAKSYCDGRNKKCVEYREQSKVFEAGAKWADEHPKNVWHDASEKPNYGSDIIALDCDNIPVCGIFQDDDEECIHYYYCFKLSQFEWEDVAKWAYISDLLPKGGEK